MHWLCLGQNRHAHHADIARRADRDYCADSDYRADSDYGAAGSHQRIAHQYIASAR